jgi:hypothetical protein
LGALIRRAVISHGVDELNAVIAPGQFSVRGRCPPTEAGSGGHGGQPELVTMPEGGEGLEAEAPSARRRLVVLFEQTRADQADDRGLVQKDAHDVRCSV